MSHIRDRWMHPGPTGRKIKSGRWGHGLRWQVRWIEGGREMSRSFANKDAAEQHAARTQLGEAPRPRALVTFGEYAEMWRGQQLHHRPSTAQAVKEIWRLMLIPTLGSLSLGRVTHGDVQNAVVAWSQHYAPSRVHIAYGYTATLFKHAAEDQLIPRTPCVRISLPPIVKAPVIPLTVEQVGEIAERVPPWYRSMVIVGAATGLRGGELRGLTWDRVVGGTLRVDRQSVDVVQGRVVFGPPKSHAGVRTVPLGEVAAAELERHRAQWPSPDLVWLTRNERPVSRPVAGLMWSRATEGMGLKPRSGWHELRHFNASMLIARGLSPRAVADRLGHEDPAMLLRIYTHLWPSDQSRATAAVDAALEGLGSRSDNVVPLRAVS